MVLDLGSSVTTSVPGRCFKNCPSLAIGLYVIPALTSGFLFVKPQMGSEAFRIEGLLFEIN